MTSKNAYRHFERKHKELHLVKRADFNDFVVKSEKTCLNCGKPVTTKFCSLSCSTAFNNTGKHHSVLTKHKIMLSIAALTPTKDRNINCNECEKTFEQNNREKFCSIMCREQSRSKKLSLRARERIDAGWNPNENRNRSSPSYLEKSFKSWLDDMNFKDYITNKTFRCNKKVYFGDFFFPSKCLLIELDGSQHKKTKKYDKKRDSSIKKHHGVLTLRISYEEYFAKTKLEDVKKLLGL